MRGRTLNDAFIILDEAQNSTREQMKMFLTRIGFGSKVVITGDITQIDLPRKEESGLVEAIKVLKGVEGIGFVQFGREDVVRHPIVARIIKAYEEYEKNRVLVKKKVKGVESKLLSKIAHRALEVLGLSKVELSIALVSDAQIKG